MQQFIYILAILAIMSFGCHEITIVPIPGSVAGTVNDNNGNPLEGVLIEATFTPASTLQEATESTKSTTTSASGSYRIEDLWDEVTLSATKTGFKGESFTIELDTEGPAQQEFVMIGSPVIQTIQPDSSTLIIPESELLITAADTTIIGYDTIISPVDTVINMLSDSVSISVEVEDPFDSSIPSFQGGLVFENSQGVLVLELPLQQVAITGHRAALQAWVFSSQLEPDAYTLHADITDVDGNSHSFTASQKLEVKEE
ncbi:MAG: carboxypeptidase regulatory-like domain-containing protein [Bacteroidota bacterium]